MKFKYFNFLAIGFLLVGCNNFTDYETSKYQAKLKDGNELHFKDNNFKIMQLTDLHYGIQATPKEQEKHLKRMVSDASPDLIVITGDTFMNATKNIVDWTFSLFESLEVPYAFTYGNHDLQGLYDSYYIYNKLMDAKNSVFIDYPDDNLTGNTNYYINIKDKNLERTLYRLYIVDSNSYFYNGLAYDYDIIHDEQIDHVVSIHKYNNDDALGLAFYHIPVYEFDDAYKQECNNEDENIFKNENFEDVHYGYKRNNAFEVWKNEANVKGHFVGHDHLNYSDILYKDVTLSFGVKSTNLIYHDSDLIGYKMITLPQNPEDYNLSCIESYKDYKYE